MKYAFPYKYHSVRKIKPSLLDITNETATDANEFTLTSITAYPNPVNQDFFKIKGLPADAIIEIYSTNGIKLFQGKALQSEITVNCSTFPKGVILVNVQFEDFKQTLKVIIN
ncbi:T9SS type A sorting domain-containing protein [Saccharicrinis sp. GN24d3]|uniref:T9SS type A sorting domain-containing protein n=1 Tax=Saccharicrinis sp. GN24d3 TaxID=3458416 RepID=UPI004035E19D